MLSAAITVSAISSAYTLLGLLRPTLPPQTVWTSIFRELVRVRPPALLALCPPSRVN